MPSTISNFNKSILTCLVYTKTEIYIKMNTYRITNKIPRDSWDHGTNHKYFFKCRTGLFSSVIVVRFEINIFGRTYSFLWTYVYTT